MQRRKTGQKEQEIKMIFAYWFKYIKTTSEPSVNDFVCNYLKISKSVLSKMRKGTLPQTDISIIDFKTIHPKTFKELFLFDIDKYVKSIKMPSEFKNKPDIIELLMPDENHFLLKICPELRSYKNIVCSLKHSYSGIPTLAELRRMGYFYPAAPICEGVSFDCLKLMNFYRKPGKWNKKNQHLFM